jgi:uncharacterized membrane protein
MMSATLTRTRAAVGSSTWTRGRPPRDRGPARPPAGLLLVAAALAAVFALIGIRAVSYAFGLTGISPDWAVAILAGSLLGSGLNVPLARLDSGTDHLGYRPVRMFGLVYLVPAATRRRVTVAVNVGGAVIPVAVSVYLVAHTGMWAYALVAAALVAIVVHLVARPVRGVGIMVPALVPALAATCAGLLLAPGHGAAVLAYAAGTVGTLVGADLSNFRAVRRMDAPLVSIGGAGTFDGVFLSGVLAVLLAALI